nr:hypothetical protein [Mycoplasmoides gallisepticum]
MSLATLEIISKWVLDASWGTKITKRYWTCFFSSSHSTAWCSFANNNAGCLTVAVLAWGMPNRSGKAVDDSFSLAKKAWYSSSWLVAKLSLTARVASSFKISSLFFCLRLIKTNSGLLISMVFGSPLSFMLIKKLQI